MTLQKFIVIAAVLLLVILGGSSVSATEAESNQPVPAETSTRPLEENEPLPFMHSDQASSTVEPSSTGLLFKTMGSMALIIGLIFAGAWAARKLGFGSTKANSANGRTLAVIDSISLGSGRSVSAIQFGSRTLLVGSTAQTFTLLSEEIDEIETGRTAPRSVSQMLAEDTEAFEIEYERASSKINILRQAGRHS